MMKKNLLGLALLSAVSLSQVAVAQEYDNRWYISGTAGLLMPDSERFDAKDSGLWGIGIGKRGYLAREHGDGAVLAMQSIKQALDPLGILNPGKVLPDAG